MPHAFGGIDGVRRRLDYLSDLGITALWLTPVMKSMSYHGYDITDYYSVDERYGTMEDYQCLVTEAHARGMKVVMDIVLNHCGSEHPWVTNPPAPTWFNSIPTREGRGALMTNYRLTTVTDPYAALYDYNETVKGAFVRTMPDLNMQNAGVMEYFCKCTLWWIEKTGIDGIRLDTFPYADRDAMEQWMRVIRSRYPDMHFIGETWVADTPFIARMQEGELDSPMDFALYEAFKQSFYEESMEPWSGLNRVYNCLCNDFLYRNARHVMAFLDNHDTNRIMPEGASERDRMVVKQLLAILLTIPRIPQVYYGTEVMMTGTTAQTDKNVRKTFPDRCVSRRGRTEEENAMLGYLRRLLQWRRTNNELMTHGGMKHFIPYKGVYVYSRMTTDGSGGKAIVVIANGNDRMVTLPMQRYDEVMNGCHTGVDVVTGRKVSLTGHMRLSPRKTLIIELDVN